MSRRRIVLAGLVAVAVATGCSSSGGDDRSSETLTGSEPPEIAFPDAEVMHDALRRAFEASS